MGHSIYIESDFSKPNEHTVPQSRGIHRRFYDRGTHLTPIIQSTVCKKKRGNVYQSWRNPRLTRLWNNERIQRQWTWAPPLAQKCRWKGNLKSRRIKQKSAKVNQIIYCSFEFQDQFRATSFLHYVLKSSTSYCGRFMGNEACQKKNKLKELITKWKSLGEY